MPESRVHDKMADVTSFLRDFSRYGVGFVCEGCSAFIGMERQECPMCGRLLPAHLRARAARVECPRCGLGLPGTAKFCGVCGARLLP